MTESSETASADLATCHGIIGHPDKPKFLAIRHSEGWAPPTVKFPPGSIAYRATMVTDGILRKYGLRTRVLRPLVGSSRYHCLELELAGRPERRLDAVWVGREEYERFKAPREGQPDPFDEWLAERERGDPHPLRPPWEFPGWFDEASHWIHFQLDRLLVQPTGSVTQYGIGWNVSCVLRVPTSEGRFYFKAGYARPPAEATLTRALAERWPEWVVAPLAVDDARNWMLNRDFREQGDTQLALARLQPFAAALAELQVDSASDLQPWRDLGCPDHGLDYLRGFVADRDRLDDWLKAGGGRLDDEEIARLGNALEAQLPLLDRLAGFELPDTLVHTDFRDDNLLRRESGPAFLDWSDAVIGHPFFTLERMLRVRQAQAPASRIPVAPLRDAEREALKAGYLKPFERHAPKERLQEALALAEGLLTFWGFTRIAEHLAWAEPESLRYRTLAAWLQVVARKLVDGSDQDRVPAA